MEDELHVCHLQLAILLTFKMGSDGALLGCDTVSLAGDY
jgi:hypothetical protein